MVLNNSGILPNYRNSSLNFFKFFLTDRECYGRRVIELTFFGTQTSSNRLFSKTRTRAFFLSNWRDPLAGTRNSELVARTFVCAKQTILLLLSIVSRYGEEVSHLYKANVVIEYRLFPIYPFFDLF